MRFDVDHDFELGVLVCTKGVRERVSPLHVVEALWRHVNGDWGDLDEEDWKANDAALEQGLRLLSSYRKGDVRF